jgi:ankyrin repeat protein
MQKGWNPLLLAARGGHETIVHILLCHKADIEAQNGKVLLLSNIYVHPVTVIYIQDQSTPLHIAAREGRSSVVELLLARRASVDAINKVSEQHDHETVHYGHFHIPTGGQNATACVGVPSSRTADIARIQCQC